MRFGVYLLAGMTFAALAAGSASANDQQNIHASCKLEPETNCSFAEQRKLKAPGIDLHDASMAAARFDEADLSGANLSGCDLQLANFNKANLSGANLEESHMHANNLQGANLQGAKLDGVSFLDADLRGANLKGASIKRVTWVAAKLGGTIWVDGRVCAPDSVGECR